MFIRTSRLAVLPSAAIALTLVFSGCSSTKKSSPDTTVSTGDGGTAAPADSTGESAAVKTKEAGTLTVCSDIPYAPFEYYANGADGDVIGIDADIVNGVAAELKMKADFIKTPFDGIFASLAAGNCDMIASSVSITAERKQANDFSNGYFKIQQTIMARKADAGLNDLPALKGKVVAAQAATTGADFAKAGATANGYTVKEFQGADDMTTALKAGQVDAVIQDSPINGYAATKSEGELVVTKVFAGGDEEYGFVVPKDNPALTAALNTGLDKLKASGTYQEILTKYLGAAAAPA